MLELPHEASDAVGIGHGLPEIMLLKMLSNKQT